MKRRIYTDTSVIGGWLEKEFRDDSIHLFEQFVQGTSIMVLSEITISEVEPAPKIVKDKLSDYI